MIVRELLAVFGLDYNGEGQRKAEKGIQGLVTQANALQSAFSSVFQATALAAPFIGLVKMASDAQENLNLLQLAFGENADAVVQWSNSAGPAIGRSVYTMRELASEFGGLLQPMIGTNEQLTEMSTGLAQLAVDLSSARNVKEQEALAALQSGLSGNIIALKRFGVNLSQTRLQQDALARGLSKNAKDWTQAQAASLRYAAIMKDLQFIQGDAANTLDQFANSTRAARDQLKDIGTELGFFLLPAAEGLLKTIRDLLKPVATAAKDFREWSANTNLAKGAILGLALVIGAILLPVLLKLAPLMLAFAAFSLILDDVWTTFEGGDSVLGRITTWLDALDQGLPGLGSKLLRFLLWPLNRLRDVLGAVGVLVASLYESFQSGSFTPLQRAIEGIAGTTFAEAKDALLSGGSTLADLVGSGLAAQGSALAGAGQAVPGLVTSGIAAQGAAVSNLVGGSKTYNFEINQQPGQSPTELAGEIQRMLDQRDEERDQAIAAELVPGAVQ